jgi:hypothetical protein
MNELNKLIVFLIDRFQDNNLVNTITLQPTRLMDNNKENIYPLVNIDYLQSDEVGDETSYIVGRFLISCVQQRDARPVKTDSKLRMDTNFIDNLNETHAILLRLLNEFRANNFSNNIDLYSQTTLTKLEDFNKNGLDGHQITIELSIPNNGRGC